MGRRKRVAAAAVAMALVGLGACTGSSDDRASGNDGDTGGGGGGKAMNRLASDEQSGGPVEPFSAQSGTGAATAAATGGGSPAGTPQGDAAQVADTAEAAGAPLPQGIGAPKVIKTASIEIEVAEGTFDAAFSKVPTIAAGLGGFVSSSTSTQAADADEHRQAAGSVVLRVPADQFEAARAQLIALGELRNQQLKGDDVSAQMTDLDARLRNLRSQEEAIRLLMTKTKTIGETIEVQRQLGTVREQIEQLAGEQARLTDAVAMSTLTVSLAEPGAVTTTAGKPSPLGEAVRRALTGAQNVLAGIIVSLGYLVPLALLLGVAWLVARPFLGRRHETEPAPAVSST